MKTMIDEGDEKFRFEQRKRQLRRDIFFSRAAALDILLDMQTCPAPSSSASDLACVLYQKLSLSPSRAAQPGVFAFSLIHHPSFDEGISLHTTHHTLNKMALGVVIHDRVISVNAVKV
jgi:hypothetical protein